MPVEVVNSVDQFREIINGGDTVVFDFWATWCGPCRTMSPIFEELSEKKSGVKFYKVDTDEQQEIIQEAGLRAMPTFIAWRKGEKIGDVVGANPGGLESLISSL